jgi:mycoredoxin
MKRRSPYRFPHAPALAAVLFAVLLPTASLADGPLTEPELAESAATTQLLAELPSPLAMEKSTSMAKSTASERPSVILYATSWCGYCKKARQLLRQLEVEFVEKDIEKNAAAGREFAERFPGSGIPVFDIEGKILRGYDEQAIRKAVRNLRSAEKAAG